MKYAIVIPDGAADVPLDELGGKTPLQAAKMPNIDWIAEHGRVGLVRNVPASMPRGSDVAILSLLGYDPQAPLHRPGAHRGRRPGTSRSRPTSGSSAATS